MLVCHPYWIFGTAGKVEWSALRAGRTYPQGSPLVLIFVKRLSGSQDQRMRTEGLGLLEIRRSKN